MVSRVNNMGATCSLAVRDNSPTFCSAFVHTASLFMAQVYFLPKLEVVAVGRDTGWRTNGGVASFA